MVTEEDRYGPLRHALKLSGQFPPTDKKSHSLGTWVGSHTHASKKPLILAKVRAETEGHLEQKEAEEDECKL